tara:strand:+ start:1642 stop:2283 length:642 start_codon:yes stop_codon:yes gene_type:complete
MFTDKLPKLIPVFPLSGVIYFPKTNLPLNIFEKRYLDLVNDCYNRDKMMGMVQSKKDSSDVYKVGCLGKISDYQKTKDGRLLINLTGLVRFEIKKEISNEKKYREFEVSYDKFNLDLKNIDLKKKDLEDLPLDKFIQKTKKFFEKNGLILNWKEFEKLDYNQRINTLAMIAPVSDEEKQKLLETVTIEEKTKTILDIIEFYLYSNSNSQQILQ